MTTTVFVSPRVVFVPVEDVMEAPGLFKALASTPVTWTEQLREVLSDRGLDTSPGRQVYDLMVPATPVFGAGWLFCNAGNGREAYGLFRAYLEALGDQWARPYIVGDAVETDVQRLSYDPLLGHFATAEVMRGVIRSINSLGYPQVAWDNGDLREHTPEQIRRQR